MTTIRKYRAMKKCKHCLETKPLDEFNNCTSSSDGKNYICRECSRLKSRMQYAKNPERHQEQSRRSRQKHIERDLARKREYYKENRQTRLEKNREWQTNNPEKVRDCKRRWKRNNPDSAKVYKHARRAKTKGTFTVNEWQELLARYGGGCLACGSTDNISVDHVIPISKGGSNTIDNIQPLCRECNCKKGTNDWDYR